MREIMNELMKRMRDYDFLRFEYDEKREEIIIHIQESEEKIFIRFDKIYLFMNISYEENREIEIFRLNIQDIYIENDKFIENMIESYLKNLYSE